MQVDSDEVAGHAGVGRQLVLRPVVQHPPHPDPLAHRPAVRRVALHGVSLVPSDARMHHP